MSDTIHFSMEYQHGNGKDWVQRKATVLNHKPSGGFVLYTSTTGLNHEPRTFADMGDAIIAGMAFAQDGWPKLAKPKSTRKAKR